MPFLETSAKSSNNIDELFLQLAKTLKDLHVDKKLKSPNAVGGTAASSRKLDTVSLTQRSKAVVVVVVGAVETSSNIGMLYHYYILQRHYYLCDVASAKYRLFCFGITVHKTSFFLGVLILGVWVAMVGG